MKNIDTKFSVYILFYTLQTFKKIRYDWYNF